jgi:hypothetical protein
MSLTIPTVRLGFDLSLAGQGDYFTIGVTPMGTASPDAFPLLGPTPVDVTEFVRSISLRRGRSKETDRFDAGQATIVLDNRTRTFDPNNFGFTFNQAGVTFDDPDVTFNDLGFGSPYAPDIKPRKSVTIDVLSQLLFTGQVEDYDLSYDISGDSTMTVKAADGFALLAGRQLSAGTGVVEDTGARINAVLNDPGVAWPPLRRAIDTGASEVGADERTGPVDAIGYLQQVNASEPGALFIGKDGKVTFRNRSSLQRNTGLVFSDSSGDLPFSSITREIGTEQLYTSIAVEYLGGTAIADNLSAQEQYGIEVLNWKTLISTQGGAEALAEYWSRKYSEPTTRLDGVEIVVNGLSPVQRGQVFGLELGDLVTVRWTPNGIGNPLEQAATVESIEHTITPGEHRLRLGLISGLSGFIINQSLLGQEGVGF